MRNDNTTSSGAAHTSRGWLFAFFGACALTAYGHAEPTATPGVAPQAASICVAPQRPAEPIRDPEWQAFLKGVDGFRACIEATKSEHEAAAAAHSASARRAVDQWNLFVRTSLNVPEDFPHEANQP
ncbi:MAG: hypothetical protein AAF515_23390 [Pseudomonadota bacterium]